MDPSHGDLEAIRKILADLSIRVDRIERRLRIEAQAAPESVPLPPVKTGSYIAPETARVDQPSALPPRPIFSVPTPVIPDRLADPGLESRIGSHWLNRIGIAALLIGVSYFLKFAFDNNWIGPSGRVAIGLLAGIATVVWSERFRSKGYKAFSFSLKAVGIGTLYLSLWAAFQVYQLVPSGVAFVMMLLVTAATAAMAWAQDAQLLAAFALTGGFSTPLLLSTGQNHEVALFSYVALLDVATLVLVTFKPWRRLLVMSYAGTLLLYVGWYLRFYDRSQLGLTLGFATLFFAVFAVAPLIALQPEDELPVFSAMPAIVAFVNAGVYFLQAYAMIEEVDKTYMAWFALALAAVYIFLSRQMHSRKISAETSRILHFLHLAVAIGFITAAVPIRLDTHWITLGWFIEAGVLLWIGNRVKSDFLNVFALAALALGVVRLLLIDNFESTQVIFNMRMATHFVAVAVLGAVAWYTSKREDEAARTVGAVATVALNVLALAALSHEVTDSYTRQISVLHPVQSAYTARAWRPQYYDSLHRIDIERDFTYSALWMAYGAMLMVLGFLRRSAFVRWQALLLIAATIAKVFMHDVFELDRGYRIVSFIVLGALLLAISFAYQRDWLKLSTVSTKPAAGKSSP